jgi:pyrroline-5-carboxylate reductase
MTPVAFIGGGNMASALIGGLLKTGRGADAIIVVEPYEAQRDRLAAAYGVRALAAADATLARAALVVWAVKPQSFADAAAPAAPHVAQALQLSVMAGVPAAAIARASGSDRVVRAMPNTPALIGRGIAGLHASAGVSAAERAEVEALLAPTGQTLWVEQESQLDIVTALSGSGPAYVFYVAEAMVDAAVKLGLPPAQARTFVLATFDGAAALAAQSAQPLPELRAQVTSKGGTTHAAITSLEGDGVRAAFERAVEAACRRAGELARGAP